jgi:hypothetical protein
VDEARRELRVAIDEFLLITSGSLGYEPHHEDRYVGAVMAADVAAAEVDAVAAGAGAAASRR